MGWQGPAPDQSAARHGVKHDFSAISEAPLGAEITPPYGDLGEAMSLKAFPCLSTKIIQAGQRQSIPYTVWDGGGETWCRWLIPSLPSFLAPSAVPTMHLHSSTGNSMTLSWTPPERPNGIILDYEIKYSEKVKQEQPFPSSSPSSWPSAPWHRGSLQTLLLGDVGASKWRVASQR